MTKDEQIKEMAKTLCIYDDGNSCCFRRQCDKKCKYGKFAKALYEEGYRKESKNYIGTDKVLRSIDYRPVEEVRRETAKEIIKSFENRFSLYYPHGILTYDDIENQIISLSEKYGVEVEE